MNEWTLGKAFDLGPSPHLQIRRGTEGKYSSLQLDSRPDKQHARAQ